MARIRRRAHRHAKGLLPADLDRVFFAERFVRVLDALGYATWRRWRVYGEEALAGREVALWLREKTLTLEFGGEPLSRYAVEFSAVSGRPRAMGPSVLFGGRRPSAGDLIEGYRMAFLFGGGLAALGACIALFVVRRDECEEAASKLEDQEGAAAFLAECRQASRM